jgi:hypothetical protein
MWTTPEIRRRFDRQRPVLEAARSHNLLLDSAIGTSEGDFRAGVVCKQLVGNSNSRKEMTAGSASCKHDCRMSLHAGGSLLRLAVKI